MKEVKKANAFEAFEIIDLEEKLEFCNFICANVDVACGSDIGCGAVVNGACGNQVACGGAGCSE
ncbi:MAG: hypothetical protein HOO91_01605 [Bacteroidales bacterium]|nr:hypothetical protein [Bacteroidales bacterium]